MENRRKIKSLETKTKAFEAYVKLKKMPQGSDTDDATLQYFVKNMELKKEVPTTLLGIIELLRINAPKCILSREDKHRFFNLLIEILPREKINLESFITYRIPSLLTSKGLIIRLVSLLGSVSGMAKQYLKEIVIILIEEGEEEIIRKIVKIVLLQIPNDPTLSSIIEVTKDISMPLVDLVMEEFDDKTYARIYSGFTLNKQLCIRNIKGAGKMEYIKAAMSEKNFEELCSFYIGDRDKKILEFLATNCTPAHRAIFHRILTDTDENVRIALLKKLSFEEAVRFDLEVCERALDLSPKVRNLVFNMFKSGAELYARHFLQVRNLEENNSNHDLEEGFLDNMVKYFLKFTRFILKGVLTTQKSEYVKVLEECDLPWEFYFHIRSHRGVDEFLSSGSLHSELCELPECKEKRRFYLKYFFKGEISKEDIAALIEEDVDSALIYLKGRDVEEYVENLMSKALAGNTNEVLMIVDLLKPYLLEKVLIHPPVSDAELLIYAHSKHSSGYIEEVSRRAPSFPVLYFLTHMKAPIDTILPLLLELRGTCEEHIEIQLAYNDKRLLQGFVDYFLNADLGDKAKSKLIQSRTFVGSMIYFVSTGQVSIKNVNFFISSIHFICMNATNEARIKQIYETYMMKVDQDTFNRFYTVCLKLKHMTLNRLPHRINNDKVLIENNDRLLFSLCDTVLGIREGKVVNETFNLYLFYEVPTRVQDMISLGHIM